ncbi:MAG: phosphatase PAP2 family protein [Bacteroidales bacterium]|nr:phosphatase PAP2 family protein [Bacteroidales bacterium]
MLETLLQLDTDVFRWINGHHCTAMDWTMWVLSQHWCIAVVLLIFFGLMTLRTEPRRWWLVLLAVGLCFLLADQGSVHLLKETVCRLRPCHALDDVRMFRTGCGGQYGFVSSHAANAFAVVTLLWMRYRKKSRLGVILLIVWAVATCYSRAYLGKHYPGDLVCGAMFGTVVGLIVWWVMNYFEKKMQKSETK